MFNKEQLIGLGFPIKDENGVVVGKKEITEVYDLENVAGFAIKLENSDSLMLIGYKQTLDLLENQ